MLKWTETVKVIKKWQFNNEIGYKQFAGYQGKIFVCVATVNQKEFRLLNNTWHWPIPRKPSTIGDYKHGQASMTISFEGDCLLLQGQRRESLFYFKPLEEWHLIRYKFSFTFIYVIFFNRQRKFGFFRFFEFCVEL